MVKIVRAGPDILTPIDLLNPLNIARQNADPDGIKKLERFVSLADRGITMLGQAADVLDRAAPIIDRIAARQAPQEAAPRTGAPPCDVIRPDPAPAGPSAVQPSREDVGIIHDSVPADPVAAGLPPVQPPPAPSINLDEVKSLLAFIVKRSPQTTISEIRRELPLPPPIAAGVAQLAQFQPDLTVSDMLLLVESNPEQIKRILTAYLLSQPGVQG